VRKPFIIGALSATAAALASGVLMCNWVTGNRELTAEPCTGNYCAQCVPYCNAVMQACPPGGTSENMEYLTTDVCIRACNANGNLWTSPTIYAPPDTMITELACRQAMIADGGFSCANAGPLGGTGACISDASEPCAAFCQLDLQVCAGNDNLQYDGGMSDCMNQCLLHYPYVVPDSGGDLTNYEGDLQTPADMENSDTLNCRFYHLENAMRDASGYGPAYHCSHTGPTNSANNGGNVVQNAYCHPGWMALTNGDAGTEDSGD
jgi:hypothetical protein